MTDFTHSDVDVIVLDLDGGAMLERCLTSLVVQDVAPARVVVWDNGSVRPTSERIAGHVHPAWLEVHRSEANLGFAGGANAALEYTDAPFVAFVNNDVTLKTGWLGALRGRLKQDADAGAVQSIILRPDGCVDGAGIDLSDGTIRQRGFGAQVGAVEGEAWGVSATAALYRRNALDDVMSDDTLFDESLFAYYEDVDLCARLRKKGWSLPVLDEPLAIHEGSASSSRLGFAATRLRVKNRWAVHRKHPEVGRASALFAEDVRLTVKALTGGRVREAFVRLTAWIG